MRQSEDLLSTPELDFEGWRDALRPDWGWYSPEAFDPKAFTGRARARNVCGFVAVDLCCSAQRVVRTQRDVRLDGVDQYYAVFQVAGESTLIQNDQAVNLAVGDAALVDSARPVTYVSESSYRHFALQLPRRSLVSHLGFDPQGGVLGRCGTAAGRALFDLVQDADAGDGSANSMAGSYMQLAIYDLVGALFAPSEPVAPVSLHAVKLFRRIRDIVTAHFADPAFGPCKVAAEAGISLRYLQKLFTAQSSTCSHFIHSVRLDHAARLLHRREKLGTSQPLSEIAYASGFSDYSHFAREFRRRFGHTPGAHLVD